jgi:glycosyltransferase involved in cell wall biosynthesis
MVARPLTIVQMLPELQSGGVERGTLELGKYLVEHGHRSMVISAGGQMAEQLKAEGSQSIEWSVGKKSLVSLKYIFPLRKLLQKEKVDILHLRSRLPAWIGYLAWKSLDKNTRPKLVTTFHGFYSINAYSGVMAKGERVIAISNAVKDHVIEHYKVPAERITLIYRGVDKTVFDPAAVSNTRIDALLQDWAIEREAGPLIMLPGRVTSWKGQDVFLRSLARLKHLPWTAVCVGELTEDSTYTRKVINLLSQLQLQDRVKFVGNCNDMGAAYLAADLVISASSKEAEAFGRVAIEAQSMGRAVIATAHGGSLETVLPGKTGWLVTPDNTDSLAKAIQESLGDRDRLLRYGEAGQKWVLDNFTTNNMCEKTVTLYKELLNQSNNV